jgi:hypothetical protein
MSSYISVDLRRLVAQRADRLCEYCLVSEEDTFFGCEVDHIISEKHGGPTDADNLAYACSACNRAKGSDIGSIVWSTGQFVRFYNPRTDRWSDHFALEDVVIVPRSDIGDVTARVLGLNNAARLAERTALRFVGRYPSPAAGERMASVP